MATTLTGDAMRPSALMMASTASSTLSWLVTSRRMGFTPKALSGYIFSTRRAAPYTVWPCLARNSAI
ncbi:MAG: hypothetical protein SPE56_03965 [Prevotella sp.]|nr:hypothetical protein [Prevotella sp.]